MTIFICHDCREAGHEPTGASLMNFPRDQKYEISFDVAEGLPDYEKSREWFDIHRGHDAVLSTDASGTFGGKDYDFDKREFRTEGLGW